MRRAPWLAAFLLFPAPLLAAPLEPLDAAALLAEVRAANGKCGFLSANASEELSLYAGRAEVAAVEVVGAEKASARLAQAAVDGGNDPCDEDSGKKVTEIFTAAREAMQLVMAEATAPAPAPAPAAPKQPAPQPAPQPQRVAQAEPQPQQLQPQQLQPRQIARPQPVMPRQLAVRQPQPQQLQPQQLQPPRHKWWPFGRKRQQVASYAAPVAPQPQPQPQLRPQPQAVMPVRWIPGAPAPSSPRDFLARFSTVLTQPAAAPVAPVMVRPPAPVAVAPAVPVMPAQPASAAGLEAYANRALGYYAGVRCHSMPAADMRRFWQNLANEHGRMLETVNPASIEAALRRAEKQSQRMACDARTRQFVLAAAAQY